MDELKKLYAEMLAPIERAMHAGETTEKEAVRAGRAAIEAISHTLAHLHRIADAIEKIAAREYEVIKGEPAITATAAPPAE